MATRFDDSLGVLAITLGNAARRAASGRLTFSDASGAARLTLALRQGRVTGLGLRAAPPGDEFGPERRAEFLAAARAAALAGADCRLESSRAPAAAPAAQADYAASDLAIDLCAVIEDAAWLQSRLTAGAAGDQERPVPATPPPAVPPAAALTSQLGFLLSRADGTLTIRGILDSSPFDPLETLRGLFALSASGVISLPSIERRPAEPAPRPERGALTDLDRFLARTAAPAAALRGSRWTPDEQAERDELTARCGTIAGSDHYSVLGLAKGATEPQVRQAYYALARQYHPDRMHRPHLADLQRDLERMFASITVAYSTLSDPEARAAYDRESAQGSHGRSGEPGLDRAHVARDAFLRGRKMLEAGETYEALRLFELAVENEPRRADYLHYLGVCQGKNPRWRKKAEETLTRALEINPGAVPTLMELARLYHKGGLDRRATQVAEKVLQWDPDNVEALALAGRGKDRGPGQAGILKGLFQKD